MAREILFRGKRSDTGEWVEGLLSQTTVIAADKAAYVATTIVKLFEKPFCGEWYEVDPATVGQYAGLNDKNGKRIFEGDLLRYTERAFNGSDVPCVNPVEFAEGGWAVDCWFLNNWLYDGKNGNIQLDEVEVVGNIHDNPELMEGGGEE